MAPPFTLPATTEPPPSILQPLPYKLPPALKVGSAVLATHLVAGQTPLLGAFSYQK